MRKLMLMSFAAFALGAGALLAPAAQAAPIGPSSGLATAAQDSTLTQDVAYVCRRVWRYGHWQRSCWWRPGPSYYRGYGFYGPRYYSGPRWRHHRPYRHYRRW